MRMSTIAVAELVLVNKHILHEGSHPHAHDRSNLQRQLHRGPQMIDAVGEHRVDGHSVADEVCQRGAAQQGAHICGSAAAAEGSSAQLLLQEDNHLCSSRVEQSATARLQPEWGCMSFLPG